MTLSRSQVSELLAVHGLRPKRKFGQNFVVDANTLTRIVRLSGVGPGDRVLEIGAGLGALTEALRSAGAEVRALEIDPALVQILQERPELADIEILSGDALTAQIDELLPVGLGPWQVVANLPYNVATPVVLRLLEDAPQVRRLLVMVQAEVGERMAAAPGDPAYGGVSIRVAYHASAKVVGKVPATVFLPVPAVESALVLIDRRSEPAVDPAIASEDEIFDLVATAFSQRRKMLRRSLAGLVAAEDFVAAGVAGSARPEELDVAAFGRLARAAR